MANFENTTSTQHQADAKLSPATLALYADAGLNAASALSPPIYQTSTFRAESAEQFAEITSAPRHNRFYTRYGNPTHSQAAAVIAAIEEKTHDQ